MTQFLTPRNAGQGRRLEDRAHGLRGAFFLQRPGAGGSAKKRETEVGGAVRRGVREGEGQES